MFKAERNKNSLQTNNNQLNIEQTNKGVDLSLNNVFVRFAIVAYYLCQILMLYDRATFEPYLGLVIASLTALLMFTPYYYVPVAIVLITPHAMGTIIMGRITQFTLLGYMLIFRLLIFKLRLNFKLSDLAWLTLGLINWLQSVFFLKDYMGNEKLTIMVVFTLWMIYMQCESHTDVNLFEKFFLAFGFGIVTNTLVSLIARKTTSSVNVGRMGIIGFASNDPNLAAMVITLGIAIIISTKYVNVWIKAICCIILFFSLITTISISGLIAAVIILLVFSVIMNKDRKNLSVLLIIILVAAVAISVFPMLGIVGGENASGEAVNYLEYYQEKISNKVAEFLGGDYDGATTDRTELMRINLGYLLEQSAIRQLFGGNHVNPLGINVSHNCFVDVMLRFGFIGFVFIFAVMCYSLIKCIQRTRQTRDCTILLCKILFIYWSMSLSLFDGNFSVLWFTVVLML